MGLLDFIDNMFCKKIKSDQLTYTTRKGKAVVYIMVCISLNRNGNTREYTDDDIEKILKLKLSDNTNWETVIETDWTLLYRYLPRGRTSLHNVSDFKEYAQTFTWHIKDALKNNSLTWERFPIYDV